MKKLTKAKLDLKRETVRALADTALAQVAGGISGLICGTETCPRSWGPCSLISKLPGC